MIYDEKESYAASRSNGLGGTDVAAILGLSPWKTAIDVYSAKVNPQSIPDLDNEMLWWGLALEPIVRDRYALRFGVEVVPPSGLDKHFSNCRPWKDTQLIIGDETWKIAAPDGWIPSINGGYEGKCSARKSGEWGEEGSPVVPAHYFAADSWYMHVTDAKCWNFGVLFSGNSLEQYHIDRDLDFEHDMVEAARGFWHDFVLPEVEPPVDQTESYGRYLARKFSLGTSEVIERPSQEILDWTAEMKLADDQCKAAEERKQLANNQLRALIGDAQKAITLLGSVGWVRPKPRTETDWKTAFLDLVQCGGLSEETIRQIVETNSKPRHDSPFLRVWWKK